MGEASSFEYDSNELSAEDLAVLQAFHEMEDPDAEQPSQDAVLPGTSAPEQALNNASSFEYPDDMLALFATEADEDISRMRQALEQMEQDEQQDSAVLGMLHRIAHKLKGTAAAIGCESMSTIARYIQSITEQLKSGTITYMTATFAFTQAVQALETTLQSIVTAGYESKTPLLELEQDYKALNLDVHAKPTITHKNVSLEEGAIVHIASEDTSEITPSPPSVRVDAHRFEQLALHTEQLLEQSTPLESAQKQVESALLELQAAQVRLQRLETIFTTIPLCSKPFNKEGIENDERATSSLVARILNEAVSRTGHIHQLKSKSYPHLVQLREDVLWDEMEIERYTESNVLANSLSEAIADVAIASSQLRMAFASLHTALKQHMAQVSIVRNDTLLLGSAPLSILITRLERAVQMIAKAQKTDILFETKGEETEIDQDILETLANPFLQLVRTYLAESLIISNKSHESHNVGPDKSSPPAIDQPTQPPVRADSSRPLPIDRPASPDEGAQSITPNQARHRIWLYTETIGNEVTIELGFSMNGNGGALEAIQKTISNLNGSITASRNDTGGISYFLRFPRSRGVVQGLLVRASNQNVVVPFSQVQYIDYRNVPQASSPQESEQSRGGEGGWEERGGLPRPPHRDLDPPDLYILNELLGFPPQQPPLETIQPILILQPTLANLAVQVDEILGDVKLLMKPLARHLQRPGIAGTAIDGLGNVLLIVNVPELVRRRDTLQYTPGAKLLQMNNKKITRPLGQPNQTVLIADDSVYIRQSLRQILHRAGYTVMEARDGIDALEQVLEHPPDVLLLDIEMPNLNGYDLLSIFRTQPQLARLKIIMLTSRSSGKHHQRALELGAHDYLTKPCPQDVLLERIRALL